MARRWRPSADPDRREVWRSLRGHELRDLGRHRRPFQPRGAIRERRARRRVRAVHPRRGVLDRLSDGRPRPTRRSSRPISGCGPSIDDEIEIIAPRPSAPVLDGLADPGVIRGVPTYIPKSLMPEDFFGRKHRLEILQGDQRIAGPVERFFHTVDVGRRLRPDRGRPRAADRRAARRPLGARRRGATSCSSPIRPSANRSASASSSLTARRARSTSTCSDGTASATPRCSSSGSPSASIPRAGRRRSSSPSRSRRRGLAAALYSGHTRDTAFRVDATVLPGAVDDSASQRAPVSSSGV